jgi:hypothetical protein
LLWGEPGRVQAGFCLLAGCEAAPCPFRTVVSSQFPWLIRSGE